MNGIHSEQKNKKKLKLNGSVIDTNEENLFGYKQ